MENFLKYFKPVFVTVGTWLAYLFGDWDIALYVLVLFMILDYATGIAKACINKCLSSEIGFKGIIRKVLILVMVMIGVALDRYIGNGQWIFRTLVCCYYIANEGLSIIENAAALGLPIPEKLKDALEQLKQGNKKEIN